MARTIVKIWLPAILAGCVLPSSPSDPITKEIRDEYRIAQELTFARFGDERIGQLSVEAFAVEMVEEQGTTASGQRHFLCRGTPAAGCYSSGGNRVQWLEGVPEVLRHEFGHGILEVLDIRDGACTWREWEHGAVAGCQ